MGRRARALPLPLLLRARDGPHALDHQLGDIPALGKVSQSVSRSVSQLLYRVAHLVAEHCLGTSIYDVPTEGGVG